MNISFEQPPTLFSDNRSLLTLLSMLVLQQGGRIELKADGAVLRMMQQPDDRDVGCLRYEYTDDTIVLTFKESGT